MAMGRALLRLSGEPALGVCGGGGQSLSAANIGRIGCARRPGLDRHIRFDSNKLAAKIGVAPGDATASLAGRRSTVASYFQGVSLSVQTRAAPTPPAT